MKKLLLLSFISIAMLCTTPYAMAESSESKDKTPGVGHCLLRGISNVGLGVLAVPSNIVYQNAEIPVLGIITGTISGAFVFVWREFAGLTDLISFGFSGRGLYFAGMKQYPWEGPWLPPEYEK